MMLLALDTSSKTASVALLKDDETIGEAFFDVGRHHSEILLPAIGRLLGETGVRIGDLDLFACTVGPGSFTGVRIGVSTVKGLALATDRPVAGVSTLEALAVNALAFPALVCPLIDAKRGQVYAGFYRNDDAGILRRSSPDCIIAPEDMADRAEGDAVFVGNGARVYKELIGARREGRSLFAPPHLNRISAAAVGMVARRQAEDGGLCTAVQLAPVYLRREI